MSTLFKAHSGPALSASAVNSQAIAFSRLPPPALARTRTPALYHYQSHLHIAPQHQPFVNVRMLFDPLSCGAVTRAVLSFYIFELRRIAYYSYHCVVGSVSYSKSERF